MLAINGLAKVTQRLDKVVRSDAQGKLTMWSQARSFYGQDDPLEEFLDEAEQCVNANRWKDREISTHLSYLFENNAKYAFQREVSNRVAAMPAQAKVYTQAELQTMVTTAQTQLSKLIDEQAELEGTWYEEEESLKLLQQQVKEEAKDDTATPTPEEVEVARQQTCRTEMDQARRRLVQTDRLHRAGAMSQQATTARAEVAAAQARLEAWTAPAEEVEELTDIQRAFPTKKSLFTWLRALFTNKKDNDAHMSNYYGRKQKKGESVKDFACELERLSRRAAITTTEESITRHFYGGLGPRMKRALQAQWDSGELASTPASAKWNWNSLLQAAIVLERDIPSLSMMGEDLPSMAVAGAQAAIRARSGAMIGSVELQEQNNWNGAYEEEEFSRPAVPLTNGIVEQFAEPIMALLQQMATRQLPATLTCERCQLVGHKAADCRVNLDRPRRENAGKQPPRHRQPSSGLCFQCGQPGHIKRDCTQQPQYAQVAAPARQPQTCFRCGSAQHQVRNCTMGNGMPSGAGLPQLTNGQQSGNGNRA